MVLQSYLPLTIQRHLVKLEKLFLLTIDNWALGVEH